MQMAYNFPKFLLILLLLQLISTPALSQPCNPYSGPKVTNRADVFKNVPFGAGERSVFGVYYFGVYVGTVMMETLQPKMIGGEFHRVFGGIAKTATSYEMIFVGKDRARAVSRASDFGGRQFKLEQFEEAALGRAFIQDKWVDFDPKNCKANETVKKDKKVKKDQYFWDPRANDALSALFHLRALDFKFEKNAKGIKVGKKERFLVYTSEKNWWFEARPVASETITVPAGTFKAIKLKLDTYLGKDLQQKGDVHLWVATEDPSRPIIKITGEVKIGSINMELASFKKGQK